MDKFNRFKDQLKGKTLLGVGPMSKNCVDVTIEIANQLQIPISLIASRRQVECEKLGGGYVENWTTEEFAKYVKEQDKGNFILISRDHGGPFQGDNEKDLISKKEAMRTCLTSYEADIKSGFNIIHIDPSLSKISFSELLEQIENLYFHCECMAKKYKNSLIYETGTEEADGGTSDIKSFNEFVKKIAEYKKIKFVVGNTGTLVKETRNVGSFDPDKTKQLVDVCNENEILFKEHNLDYVKNDMLEQHPIIGVHSANVAPEFGVVETRALLSSLKLYGLEKEYNRFVEIAMLSGKYQKWLVGDRELTDIEKTTICGHYILANPEIVAIKEKLNSYLDIDLHLQSAIKDAIMKYLKSFGWTNN